MGTSSFRSITTITSIQLLLMLHNETINNLTPRKDSDDIQFDLLTFDKIPVMKNELYQKLLDASQIFEKDYLPGVSVDCVIFGFDGSSLKALLLKPLNSEEWGLPGGYVKKDEDIREGANRILNERTGAADIYLKQFEAFGRANRTKGYFNDFPGDFWSKRRFVSIGYYALINYKQVIPRPDGFSDACEWKDIDYLPDLMMDHPEILDHALLQLRRDLNYIPVGFNLLPEKFTMPELQTLYEIILGKKLNRGNFYRKMTRYGILEKLAETRKGGAHKAPDLYSFNKDRYLVALKNGLQESW